MAGIAVNAIEFIIAFNIRNAQQRTKEMENSLRGLQSATASTFGGMISAAMGPFAGGATSIVSEIFGPMNQFAWNNKGSALQALADNPWGRATGGTQLFKYFRSSRSDLTATNKAQENFLGFIGNWSRKTGQSMSDQQQRGMFELFQFQEQAVEKEVDRKSVV